MIRATVVLALACSCTSEPTAEPDEELSAGPFTVFEDGQNAFGHPLPGLDLDLERAFFRGRALFRDDWVTAPASTETRDGLGPLFNARNCEACHIDDGRGHPPLDGETQLGPMLVRLAIDASGTPEPTYGGQFQSFAISSVTAEGRAVVTYDEQAGTYGDGTPYSLRRPTYGFEALGYGPLAPGVLLSPRNPPPMIGLGLLAAIELTDDPADADGDGISGRLGAGRFGLKASQPTVAAQVTAAFNGDIGLTSAQFPVDDCTTAQASCTNAISGGAPELIEPIADDVTAYSELLAVPARRDWITPTVLRGKALFTAAGCASCHRPQWTATTGRALFAGVTFRPYTDLLLHDMGPDLADDLDPEWRTPPLWGLGLTSTVSGHELLLHDGRARGAAEAILWHGGEAEASREYFRTLSKAERDELLAFLASL